MAKQDPRVAVYQAFQDEQSFGSTLLVATAQIIPLEELVQLSLDTIVLELRDEIKLNLVDSLIATRLGAALSLLSDPQLFYGDVVSFIDICNLLSGEDIDPDVFDPADPLEMAWAMNEAFFLDPPERGEDRFSEDVKRYMGITLSEFGHLKPPGILSMAIMPGGYNPAMELSDQPDMVAASVEIQSGLNAEIEESLAEMATLREQQLTPFLQPHASREQLANPAAATR